METKTKPHIIAKVTYSRFTLIELLVKITCFSGDLAKAHEV